VGVTDVEVPGSKERSVHRVVEVRTASRAVTGVVDTCTPR
jgi:hypothetical protein